MDARPKRPKLHYHRSGIVRASLTGAEIEAATSHFTPLPERAINTFLSIVAARPGEFSEQEFRRGDISTVEGTLPGAVRLSLAIIQPSARRMALGDMAGLEPVSLVSETPSQFVVDLADYGHSVFVLGQVTSSDEPPPGSGPSVTVAAYPEPDDGQDMPLLAHALWNSDARNPLLGYDADFLWEADRDSRQYRDRYARRFNRLPPWLPASGSRRESAIVLALRARQYLNQVTRFSRRR